jgi:hypothetical protein
MSANDRLETDRSAGGQRLVKYRLLTAYWDDGIYHKGGIIERPDNWQGPRRSTRTSSRDMPAGTNGAAYRDVLLFERVSETR